MKRRDGRNARIAAQVPAAQAGPGEAAELADDRARLTTAIRQLPEKDRRVLAFRYLMDLTEDETALALDVARGTVKSRTYRALGKLRARLDPTGGIR